jgi:hypothetical protein
MSAPVGGTLTPWLWTSFLDRSIERAALHQTISGVSRACHEPAPSVTSAGIAAGIASRIVAGIAASAAVGMTAIKKATEKTVAAEILIYRTVIMAINRSGGLVYRQPHLSANQMIRHYSNDYRYNSK